MNPVFKKSRPPMNPISNNQPNSPFSILASDIQNGADVRMLAQNIMQKDPRIASEIQNAMRSNQDPREFAIDLCRRYGGNLDEMMRVAAMVGAY